MTDPWAPPPQQPGPPPYHPGPRRPYGYPPPPYGYPPPSRPLDKQVAGLAAAVLLLLTLGVGSALVRGVSGAVEEERAQRRADRQQLEEADKAFDDALAGPPDTATASPAPDGSRVYSSPAVEPSQHAFRLRLPRGWEGRHVGVREDDANFSDSILLLPGSGAAIVIYRIELGARPGSAGFERALIASLKSDRQPVTLTSPIRATTIGDGEPAYAVRARMTDDDGDAQTLRVVVFEHAGETFQVVQIAPEAGWEALARAMNRIVASWRWG